MSCRRRSEDVELPDAAAIVGLAEWKPQVIGGQVTCCRIHLRYAVAVALAVGYCVASAAANGADVADEGARSYWSAAGGRAWANDRDEARDGAGLKLSLGRTLGEHWSAELSASYVDFETGSDEAKRIALGLEAVYAFNPLDWTPLLFVGAGAVQDAMSGRHRSVDFTASGGFGLLTPPMSTHELRMRMEVRYVYDALQAHERQVHAYLGVMLPLQTRKKIEAARTETEGVVEHRAVQESPRSDRGRDDFIADSHGRAEAPHPAPVESERMTNETRSIILAEVNFDFDSARLSEASRASLMQIARTLRERQAMIEVGGHTDNLGSDAYNLDLSSRRAQGREDRSCSRCVGPRADPRERRSRRRHP